jgi:hypothetical protein
MTCEELKEFYEKVTANPNLMAYLTLQEKLNETCESFNKIKIDVTSEDDTFKNLMSFGKQFRGLLDDMEYIYGKLDSEQKEKVKAEQRKAAEGSVEHMIKKIRNKGK